MSVWYAKSLHEYIRMIDCISEKHRDRRMGQERKFPLWFRGNEQTDVYYYLDPGIYRDFYTKKEKNLFDDSKNYGTLWLKEEYRFQHFVARNYDKVSAMPESYIEWQEVMQHYFSKTRLMDWSESAVVALSFALEAYINPVEDHEVRYKRRHNSPVVWVLNPVKLNRIIYQCFKDNIELVEAAMEGIHNKYTTAKMHDMLQRHEELYFSLDDAVNGGVNGLVSLSGLEALRKSKGGNLQAALDTGNMNPFFFLLLKYYSEGLEVEVNKLPPLAIIHPQHSTRIHEQKGAFTIFPYYNDKGSGLTEIGISPYAMEYMPLCRDCLEEIILTDAWKIAEELKDIGVRRSHMYPEMENITKDFENIKY
ncbi:MAG: FRG domain-containing protein [Butyrivibrio sp.]|nr:FRG domain-containing protein [Butyrivibrio sp.]